MPGVSRWLPVIRSASPASTTGCTLRSNTPGFRAGVAAEVFAPAVKLLLAQNVAGVRKRRYPFAVAQVGVPAAVMVVEVGADDQVDSLRLEADCGEAIEEGHNEIVEETDRVRSAVARAGIDQHHLAVGAPGNYSSSAGVR